MKKIVLAILISITSLNVFAGADNATQTVKLELSNVIEISFASTGLATGNMVNLPFTSMQDYSDGIVSNDQQLVVRSNEKFHVRVKANASKFSYTGSTTPIPVMNVNKVLSVRVSNNQTGGTISGGYASFKFLNTTGKEIIKNGNSGDNQNFSVQYKATPGFSYPAGNYSIDIIYTATQA